MEQEQIGGLIVIGPWPLLPTMPGATTAGTDRQRVAATVVQWSAAHNTTATITAARAETVQALGGSIASYRVPNAPCSSMSHTDEPAPSAAVMRTIAAAATAQTIAACAAVRRAT